MSSVYVALAYCVNPTPPDMYEPSHTWSYNVAAPPITSKVISAGSLLILDVWIISANIPNGTPPGSLAPLARLAGNIAAIPITSACLAAYEKSAIAASPAHKLYAVMKLIPICIADHLDTVPPSQALTTNVGTLLTW